MVSKFAEDINIGRKASEMRILGGFKCIEICEVNGQRPVEWSET